MKVLYNIAYQYMKAHKGRTFLTGISIVLSIFLFSSLVLFRNANQDYVKRQNINLSGDYQIFTNIDEENNINISIPKKNIDQQITVYDYAVSLNNDGSYIDIKNISEDTNIHVFSIWEGKIPEKENDILISREYAAQHSLKIGDTFDLAIGIRKLHNKKVPQYETNFLKNEKYEQKKILKSVRVTGIYTPNIDKSNTAIKDEMVIYEHVQGNTGIQYIKLKGLSKNEWNVMKGKLNGVNISSYGESLMLHEEKEPLLKIYDAIILFVMFMLIVFLYNIFKMSFKEKSKYFGILKSMGATNKQIFMLTMIEVFLYFVIVFPIGILLSFIGTSTILKQLDIYNSWIGLFSFRYRLLVNPSNILSIAIIILVIMIVTCCFSIIKIRNYSSIQLIKRISDKSPKKVKSLYFTYHLFGMEGLIGKRYRLYNKAGHRSLTSAVLICFILLFVSVFYLDKTKFKNDGNAVIVRYKNTDSLESYKTSQTKFYKALKEITSSNYILQNSITIHNISFPKSILSKEFKNSINSESMQDINLIGIDSTERLFDNNRQGILINQGLCSSATVSNYSCPFFNDTIKQLKIPKVNQEYTLISDKTGYTKIANSIYTQNDLPSLYISEDAMEILLKYIKDEVKINFSVESSAVFYRGDIRKVYSTLEELKTKNPDWILKISRSDENPSTGIDKSMYLTLYAITLMILAVCAVNLLSIVVCNALYMKRDNIIIASLGIELKQKIKLLFFELGPMLIKTYIGAVVISVILYYFLFQALFKDDMSAVFSIDINILIVSFFCLLSFICLLIAIILCVIKKTSMMENLRTDE